MTVHEFVMMLMEACESVDMGDTEFRINTPWGDFQPYTFVWRDEGEEGGEALMLDILEFEDE